VGDQIRKKKEQLADSGESLVSLRREEEKTKRGTEKFIWKRTSLGYMVVYIEEKKLKYECNRQKRRSGEEKGLSLSSENGGKEKKKKEGHNQKSAETSRVSKETKGAPFDLAERRFCHN